VVKSLKIRVNVGPGYRLYFTHQASVLIVMLDGGDKSSQARDIKRARQILAQLESDP
jgi:putative addiction module killer protein